MNNKKIEVTVEVILRKTITVEGDMSVEDAIDKVETDYYDGEIILIDEVYETNFFVDEENN